MIWIIPPASEFSPSQIDLKYLLKLAKKYDGERYRIAKQIKETYYKTSNSRDTQANNTLMGMKNYGIITPKCAYLTNLGEQLFDVIDNEVKFNERFRRHILFNLRGTDYVNIIRNLQSNDEKVTNESIKKSFDVENKADVPIKNIGILGMWLKRTGAIGDDWKINEDILRQDLEVADQFIIRYPKTDPVDVWM